jgi:hypothetical protein
MLTKLETIVNHMGSAGWKDFMNKAYETNNLIEQQLKEIQYERTTLNPLRKLFLDLEVAAISVATARYIGYRELLENAENTELLDLTVAKNKEILQSEASKCDKIAAELSATIQSLLDLKEKIIMLGKLH